MAWYAATPSNQKISRLEAIQSGPQRIVERPVDSNLPEDNKPIVIAPTEVELPEIDPAFSYLLELFALSGQAKSTGMGLVALDWQELRAFRLENELDLTIWERQTLKRMSEAYSSEYSLASNPNRPAPHTVEKEPEEIDHIAQALKMMEVVRSMRKRN